MARAPGRRSARRGCDTLVLGAGAAGLAAAAELAEAGQAVVVLEARERVGGRIWSRSAPGLGLPLELGAEFIHGQEARSTFALLERAGRPAVDLPEKHWLRRGRRLAPMDDLFPRLQRALARTRATHGRDRSFAELLERSRSRELSGRVAEFACLLAEGFDAADPRRASARVLAREWSSGGSADSPTFRPLGGYAAALQPLLRALRAGGATLALGTVVRELHWSARGVECTALRGGRTQRFVARRCIVTLPLGVLQAPPGDAAFVRFTPPLAAKRHALSRLASGPIVKLLLRFDKPFWEELQGERFREATFFHAPEAAFPTFWTALPARAPLLVAWAGGPRAARLPAGDRERLVQLALQSLHLVFGRAARIGSHLRAAHVHDWSADPFARGAYSWVLVGGEAARRELARPLRGTLFLAGEATDGEHAGTVEGALRSGERAARDVLGTAQRR
ncbi:MAG TPA: NAD(P)/FAD-dependent oxidoreductase [Planctomycetota bacterium]|nr:NAD(P)/FAD-dependent oxidoreductase [Planctomycetota bacterium]